MRPLEWTLIQSYKKRKFRNTKEHQGHECTGKRPHEDTVRGLPSSASQGEVPQEKPNP